MFFSNSDDCTPRILIVIPECQRLTKKSGFHGENGMSMDWFTGKITGKPHRNHGETMVSWKIYRKTPYLMVKTNPSRFSSFFCVKNGWEVLSIISMDDTGGHAENQSYIPHNDLTVLPKPLLEIIVNFRGIIPKWPN